MIIKLEHSHEAVAKGIYRVFQNAYKVEAKLIGTLSFPPLSRSAKDIGNSTTHFYGFHENNSLAAIIEIVVEEK